MTDPILRPATADDVDAIATLFHEGWHDVHPGRVPYGHTYRVTRVASHPRAAKGGPVTAQPTVAGVDGTIAGFVMVSGDEAEQVYVDRGFRGSGAATLLLSEAERQIAAGGHDIAWLAVVRGNARAQAFYAKQGWVDEGDFDYPVTALGEHFISPCRKFTKRVR